MAEKSSRPQKPAENSDSPQKAAEISHRPHQYLVASRPGLQPFGVQPLGFAQIRDILGSVPDVTVHRTIEPKGLGALSAGTAGTDGVLVTSMSDTTAQALAQSPQVVVERNHLLNLSEQHPGPPAAVVNPSNAIPFGSSVTYQLRVVDEGGKGIEQAMVTLYGDVFPTGGATDSNGNVTLTLYNQVSDDPNALHVNPKAGYWDLWVENPQLDPTSITLVGLTPLTSAFPDLTAKETYGWGEAAMGLDQLPPEFRGAGVKVAVIDSGTAALTHANLKHVKEGRDLTVDPPATTWTNDEIAHGSHCAGVITGSAATGGIRGFAPEAEVHTLKVFKGGRFSSLLDALDYCIEKQIDVVNMSLGSPEPSLLVLEKIATARQHGIACIVAAGNSAGNVQFPGTSPDVLTVAAIGMAGTFPNTTYHAQQIGPQAHGAGGSTGYFSAKFTCYGPEIDVCAPGVAILSSVPPNGFAAWDGTSFAAPHVTGMAALLLAHHPDFQGDFRTRNDDRVRRLFTRITQSATHIDVGDPRRTGWGLPNVVRAFQLPLPAGQPGSPPLQGGQASDTPLGGIGSTQRGQDMGSFAGRLETLLPFQAGPPQGQFTPQGFGDFLGSAGGALGGMAGAALGDPRLGQQLGGFAGQFAQQYLPFQAGPPQGMPQSYQQGQQGQFSPQGWISDLLGPSTSTYVTSTVQPPFQGQQLGQQQGTGQQFLPFQAGPQYSNQQPGQSTGTGGPQAPTTLSPADQEQIVALLLARLAQLG
ncbi:S8 family serine peptidase [Kocuria arenosa]|uniref:S8 family serine peptidase n=1 Tax=Kocuria arenosa TaxID=3071446 RepID=UPI0034D67E1C